MDFQLEHTCHYNAAVSPDLLVTWASCLWRKLSSAGNWKGLRGGWKMTYHKRAGVSLGLLPQKCQKSLLQVSRTPTRVSTEESKNESKSEPAQSKQLHSVVVHVVVDFNSHAPASAALCYWTCAWRSNKCTRQLNLRTWHEIIYVHRKIVRVKMCYCSLNFSFLIRAGRVQQF